MALSEQPAIRQQIKQFVAEELLYTDGELPFNDDASFLDSGAVDSLGVMKLVTFVQEVFGIEIVPLEVTPDNFDSINQLTAYVEQKVATAPPPSLRQVPSVFAFR
ncbi:MAG TPA: acyl carrier protein [Bryobacteraceae bacterium]|nr:acyl carrier protein [Bryobacteraceae bacterium]HPT28001.1 acyl carrier protein [Bryobacteraceae bacterium]